MTIKDMIEDLCEVEYGLTDREVEFIEDMAHIDEVNLPLLSKAQRDWIEDLHERHCS